MDDIVERLQAMLDGPVPMTIERADVRDAIGEIEQLRSEVNGMVSAQNGWGKVQRLKEAGDALVAVMRSGSDCGWDKAIDGWEKARRG